MIAKTEEIRQPCQSILKAVKERAKVEVNPLLIRIQYVIQELQTHLLAPSTEHMDVQQKKYHWSVLYRDGDSLDEMATLIHNTTPVFIRTDVDFIKQYLVFLTNHVVQIFGKGESLYIITPKFQELW